MYCFVIVIVQCIHYVDDEPGVASEDFFKRMPSGDEIRGELELVQGHVPSSNYCGFLCYTLRQSSCGCYGYQMMENDDKSYLIKQNPQQSLTTSINGEIFA